MGELSLWSMDRERPAALVAAAARIAGGSPRRVEDVVRGLRALSRLPGWPGRLASYLLARRDALEAAIREAMVDGDHLEDLVREVVDAARRGGVTSS